MAGGEREGSTAPGAASCGPGRRGSFSFAGRSAVFRRRRFGPALLRKAPRCSCPAVACGDRGVSDSTWAAGLLFGADGVAVTVSVDRTAWDASLATATTSNATTVLASMQDAFSVPSCLANVPEVSRDRRLPGVMSTPPAIGCMAHPVDPPPPPVDRAAWRIRAHAGASPAATPPYSRIAPLRFGTWASQSTSYGCRARTGLPPACWSPSLSGWLPTTPPQGGSNMAATIANSTKAAPEKSSYHPCRCCAQGRFSAPSLPDSPTGRHAAEGAFGRFRPPAGSDGALRLRLPARRTPPRRASSSRWRGSPPCRAGRGSPPASGPPRRDAWPRCRRTSSARPSHQ